MTEPVDAQRAAAAKASWPRRALVGLWLLVFALAGAGLATRWDSLMRRIVQPPAAASAGGGALR